MTTIAWDGKTLACDRLAISNGLGRTCCKLFDCGNCVYAGSGQLAEVIECADWLRAGAPEGAARPTFEENDIIGIVVVKRGAKVTGLTPGGAYFVAGKRPVFEPIHEAQAATGSGRDFAISAMAFGQDARSAIVFAMRYDLATGIGIDAYDLGA
jgi:hypothetical protein